MEHLQIDSRHYQVPSVWNELTEAQLLAALAVLHGPERPHFRLELLAVLLGQSVAQLLRDVAPVALVQLLDLGNFFFAEQCRLTAQLLPELRVKGQRWAGPRASFRNLRFAEFIFADTYFVHYCATGDAPVLDKFLAVLYRPARPDAGPHQVDYDGDQREPFNEHRLDYHAQRLRRLPLDVKRAVLTWYRGCRAELADEFPEVFAPGNQEEAAKSDWSRVLRKMSGGAFGAMDQTAKQLTRTILAEIEDNIQDSERARQQARRSHS
jgi:hypothetical protein